MTKIKCFKPTLKTMEKLNELNEKYHISCFELEYEDVYEFLCRLYDLVLDKDDREYVEYLLDLGHYYEQCGNMIW